MKCGWIRGRNYCLKPSILKFFKRPVKCSEVPPFLCKKKKRKKRY